MRFFKKIREITFVGHARVGHHAAIGAHAARADHVIRATAGRAVYRARRSILRGGTCYNINSFVDHNNNKQRKQQQQQQQQLLLLALHWEALVRSHAAVIIHLARTGHRVAGAGAV